MTYQVRITPRAERDLSDLFHHINATNSNAALEWYRGLKEAIVSLQEHPSRCPLARERRMLRHLLYGQKPHVYRVIFRIIEKKKWVEVLHIRHGARRELESTDLE